MTYDEVISTPMHTNQIRFEYVLINFKYSKGNILNEHMPFSRFQHIRSYYMR